MLLGLGLHCRVVPRLVLSLTEGESWRRLWQLASIGSSGLVELFLTGQAHLAHLCLRHHLLTLVLIQLLLELGGGLLSWGAYVGGVVRVSVLGKEVRRGDLNNFFGRWGFDCGGATPLE